MKETLLDILVCPLCRTGLALQAEARRDDVIESGSLTCKRCGAVYRIEREIPLMMDERFAHIQAKKREIEGWVAMAKQDNWYAPDDRADCHLPYLTRDLGWEDPVWLATERSFDRMLREHVQPGMRVLEVGAARCWGGRYFAERDCDYVGTDILADDNIGLGRGRFFIERFGAHFERVQADGEYLPFRPDSFDLTYAVAALHHSMHVDQMIGEMARVTRPGGLVLALNEGFQPFRAGANPQIQSREKSFGINEHVHPITHYLAAFRRSGLRVLDGEPALGLDGVRPLRRKLYAALRRLPAGPTLGLVYLLGLAEKDCSGMSLYARKI